MHSALEKINIQLTGKRRDGGFPVKLYCKSVVSSSYKPSGVFWMTNS
jgi:hypothetical protein